MKRFLQSHSNESLLLLALVVAAPIFLYHPVADSSPMGYAGLFAQMAEQIAESNFRLPQTSPYYGPGSIPFAYPPFGLYLLAILIKLTGEYLFFLRVLPPLISFISLIPLFYLTRQMSGSSIAGAIAVVLLAVSSDLYMSHAWAAGITRAPAFFFSLAFFYFLLLQYKTRALFYQVLAGICLGLVAISHLRYLLFCFAWFAWWTLFDENQTLPLRLKSALNMLLISAMITSIWLIPTVVRHGMEIFLNAFGSRGAGSLILFWQDISGIVVSFWTRLETVRANAYLFFLVILGFVSLFIQRKYIFPAFFLVIILIFPESERFISLLACMIAGMGLPALLKWLYQTSNGRLKVAALVVFLIPIIGLIWWIGFQQISKSSPFLDGNTFDLANKIQSISSPEVKYMALLKQDEAEWLPFLFQREPLVAQWGSEWLGEYDKQTYLMSLLRECQKNQDWACIERVIADVGMEPDYVITYTSDRKLNDQIKALGVWHRVYRNGRYLLWSKAN